MGGPRKDSGGSGASRLRTRSILRQERSQTLNQATMATTRPGAGHAEPNQAPQPTPF